MSRMPSYHSAAATAARSPYSCTRRGTTSTSASFTSAGEDRSSERNNRRRSSSAKPTIRRCAADNRRTSALVGIRNHRRRRCHRITITSKQTIQHISPRHATAVLQQQVNLLRRKAHLSHKHRRLSDPRNHRGNLHRSISSSRRGLFLDLPVLHI